ncbi:uncharacterized protein LOC141599033 [Silene latifolia]|uniref:uncharacterized protein LOC141599033 n=1 Tax=Silene latifolia TaxID=37657 RepID=UPI003D775B54
MRSNKRVKMEHEFRKSLRRAKKLKACKDPFTRLPDQVIASHILSRFTLEEGARYCILSHRWKKLWGSTIGSKLIFAPEHLRIDERSKMLAQIKADFQGRRKRSDIKLYRQAMYRLPLIETVSNRIKRLRPCFERWISNVLQAYSMPELDELCVRFPFDSSNNDSIDMWVECALKKGITRLELDLFKWDVGFSRVVEHCGPYMFPKIDKLQGMLADCVGLNLRDVRLKRVFIDADVIEYMVAHFPIERLSIEFSDIYEQLNISGELVRLKSLDLSNTRIFVPVIAAAITSLRISASSLTSLKYAGRESELLLEDVPCLSELSVDRQFCKTFLPLGLQQEVYMSGLTKLELAMSEEVVRNSINYPLHLTTSLNLEELTVEIHGGKDDCFLWPVVLINAAPFLRKFSVKLHTSFSYDWDRLHDYERMNQSLFERHQIAQSLIRIRNAAKQVRNHPCLKTVESLRRDKKLKSRKDPFTRLPDEVIASHILSRFTLEEGARYCILSHRWKKLWASTIGSKLIFASEHLQTNKSGRKRFDIKLLRSRLPLKEACNRIRRLRACFQRWISAVFQAYSLPVLDELSVRFPFDFSNNDSIDTWVECALQKGITRLELDLFTWGEMFSPSSMFPAYKFPKIDKLEGMLANSVGLNLRDVRLKYVSVSADVIEFMVAHFPIELLSIEFSDIYKLNISGESVRLKRLEIIRATTYLRISASSLTSLKFSGGESGLLLEHVPCLSELSVDRDFCTTFLPSGLQNGGYMSGLKRLELAMSEEVVRSSINYPKEFTTSLNLEELKVEIHGRKDACFLWPVVLIKAAPFLRKFSVKLHTSCKSWWEEWHHYEPNENDRLVIERRQFIRRRSRIWNAAKQVGNHHCLKTVEVHNIFGHPSELELVEYLLPVSSLEQILISPNRQSRSLANVIATSLPPASKAKLVIL